MAPEPTTSKSSFTSCTEEKPTFTKTASTAFFALQKFSRSKVSQRDPAASK
jgi:hypothetical protein